MLLKGIVLELGILLLIVVVARGLDGAVTNKHATLSFWILRILLSTRHDLIITVEVIRILTRRCHVYY